MRPFNVHIADIAERASGKLRSAWLMCGPCESGLARVSLAHVHLEKVGKPNLR